MKKYYTLIVIILFLSISFSSCVQTDLNQPKHAKYVFFFIGDGMGEAHVNLAESYLAAVDGEIGIKHLNMSDFPTMGLQTTFAQNRFITGSAASGTALATGHKTSIATISMNADHTAPLYSVAYFAHKKGLKVGVLTSVGINHATPAVFYAHQPKRNKYYEIALQLPKSNFNVFGGGGFINPKGDKTDTMPDAYEITKKAGYKVVRTVEDFNKLKSGDDKVLMVSPNILSQAEMPYSIDVKDKNELTLADFTQKAIDLLDNPNGFFLMVEGGKIDWAAHANDAATVIGEVKAFDDAIGKALEFYKKHPDETLIVITADHETGGLALGYEKMHYESNLALLQQQKGSINALNDTIEKFIKNKGIDALTFDVVLDFGKYFFGIDKKELDNEETEMLQKAYNRMIKLNEKENLTYSKTNIVAETWLKIFDNKAGVAWTTHSHTGIPVPVRAIGINHSIFDGFYDNTDIPKKIAKVMNLKFQ